MALHGRLTCGQKTHHSCLNLVAETRLTGQYTPMKINMNQTVRVRFTRLGSDIALRTGCTMKQFTTGEFQLWELANLLAPYFQNGRGLFENDEIEIVEPLIPC
jgi:hypothetical protein